MSNQWHCWASFVTASEDNWKKKQIIMTRNLCGIPNILGISHFGKAESFCRTEQEVNKEEHFLMSASGQGIAGCGSGSDYNVAVRIFGDSVSD